MGPGMGEGGRANTSAGSRALNTRQGVQYASAHARHSRKHSQDMADVVSYSVRSTLHPRGFPALLIHVMSNGPCLRP